jgi:hypothetical protein
MDTLISISAQYYENYNTSGEGAPYWKPKGGQLFTLRADSDFFFYDEETCVEAIKELLERTSNAHCRYEYIEHELIFSEPIELQGFQAVLDKHLEQKYATQ